MSLCLGKAKFITSTAYFKSFLTKSFFKKGNATLIARSTIGE